MTPRQFLGDELKRARLAAGYSSQESLAAVLGFDRSVIGKAETGERPPTADVLAAWCESCRIDLQFFARLAELARSSDKPDTPPAWFELYLERERAAHTLWNWSPMLVPGLLQTAEYARAVFVAAGADTERANDLLGLRIERQAIFDHPEPPHVVAIIDEAVLHRLTGSQQAMSDQLAHLAAMAERPNILVQIVPTAIGANAGLSGAFDIAFGDGTLDTLRMDAVEDVTTESRPLVRRARVLFDLVRGAALPCDTSRTLIVEAAEQWKTR
jgi:transcriptional regulator with XRE-family HTH domain